VTAIDRLTAELTDAFDYRERGIHERHTIVLTDDLADVLAVVAAARAYYDVAWMLDADVPLTSGELRDISDERFRLLPLIGAALAKLEDPKP